MRSRRKHIRSLKAGFLTTLIGLSLLVAAPSIFARSTYLISWEFAYPDSRSENNAQCLLCHLTADGSGYNPYGTAIRNESQSLPLTTRFENVENVDSDSDPTGSDNITEINASTQPGWCSGGGCPVPPEDIGQLDPTTTDDPPVADANGPYSGAVGEPVSFDGTGSTDDGTIVSYQWDFGDNSTGAGATVSHTYVASGEYTVTLTVTDDANQTDQDNTTATIAGIPLEPPVADPNGPYIGTAGIAVVFDGSGSSDDGTITNYDWDFGDGNSGTGVAPSHTYASGGQYDVSLTVTDNDGLTDTASTSADINQPPVSDPGGPYSGTIGVAVDFDGRNSSDSDGQIVSYNWDFGDNSMGTGPTPSHVYAAEGNYVVVLTVTDNDGATDNADTTASIGPVDNTPPTADAGGPYVVAIDQQPVTFDASGSDDPDGTIVAYTWDFGDGSAPVTVTTVQVEHTYASEGDYTASLTVTDNEDAEGIDSAAVTITIGNPPPVADAGGPYAGKIGQSVQFDGSGSSDDGTIVSYEWEFGDGSTGTGVSPTHAYASAGQYTVILTVTDDGVPVKVDSDSTTADISDLVPPVADPGEPYNGVVGVEVSFDGSGSDDPDGTIVEWNWDFGDNSTGTGETTTHAYAAPGNYTVTLTVVDDDALEDAASTSAEIVDEKVNPIADPNGPYEGKEGQELTFDGTGSYDPDGGNMLSYDWDFGDGNTGIGPMPTNVYATEGVYDVTLVVTDEEGQVSDPASTTATIVPDEAPTALPGGPYTAQIDQQPVDFDGSASFDPDGEVVSWDWDFGDNSTGSGEVTSHTYADVGEYTVALTVTDDFGNTDTAETTATITPEPVVDLPPVADANGPYNGLVGEVITFDGTGSTDPNGDETIVSYEWDFGDGNMGSGETVEHAYADPGPYSVSLTVMDDTGLSDSDGTTATIDEIGENDVYLNRVRVTSRLVGNVGREWERDVMVLANGTGIEQDATVVLTADVPDGVEVVIDPESLTETVVPGTSDTEFPFKAGITCAAPGSYEIVWTATIDADENSDETNDTATAVTDVECRGSEEADVYLNRVRVTSRLVGNVGREWERDVTVLGGGDTIEQDATVVLMADAPAAVEVEIDPESVTEVVGPNGDTRFEFEADIACVESGAYEILWSATITADENSDSTNDTATSVTEVECRGR